MALETIKIAELPFATQVVGDDYFVVEQPDKTKKATISQVISDLDLTDKSSLTGPGGAAIIGTEDGEGVQQSLDTDRGNTKELWRRALYDLGLTLADGSFEEGAVLTYTTDAIWHMAGSQCYTWAGTFPKTVPAKSTPSSTGGVSAASWVAVEGLSLLEEVTEIKNETIEAKDEAENARDEAQAYVLQASELGNLYPSTTAGIAATTDGQYFQVPQGSGNSVAFRVYKNNGGVAQEVAAVPGVGSIQGTIRMFPTIEAAQAEVVAGNILEGQLAFVRSSDDGLLADEYINNSGQLILTGIKIPADGFVKESVNKLLSPVRMRLSDENDIYTNGRLRDLDPQISDYIIPLDYIRQYGSEIVYSKNHDSDSVFKLDSLSLAGAARLSIFKIQDSIGVAANIPLLEGEEILGATKKTNYIDLVFDPLAFYDMGINTDTGFTIVRIDVALGGSLPSDTTRIIRDRSGRFAAYTPDTIYGGTTEGVTYSASVKGLLLKLSNKTITDAGFTLTTEGVIAYIKEELAGFVFQQQTADTLTLPFVNLFRVAAGTVTVTSTGVADSDRTVMCVGTFFANKVSGNTKTKAELSVENLSKELTTVVSDSEKTKLRNLALEKDGFTVNIANTGTVGNPVALTVNTVAESRFILDKFSLANVARRTILRMNDSLGTAHELIFLEGEYTNGVIKYSPYTDFVFEPREFYNVISDETTGYTSMDIAITLPSGLPNDTSRIIRDRAGVFGAYTPVTIKSGKGVTYNAANNRLILNIPSIEITQAGYDLSQKGIISYVVDHLSGYRFSQLGADISTYAFCNIFELAEGPIYISTDGGVEADKVVTMSGRLFSKSRGSGINTLYKRLSCPVVNNLEVATGTRPVYIKCTFSPGEVISDDCLIVKDSTGKVYPSQWDPEWDFNPRRNASIGYWADGSLRCGSVIIFDDIPANSRKDYVVEAHPTPRVHNKYARTTRETQTSLLVTADDGTQVRFDSVVGWLPYKLTRDGNTYTSICQHLLITRLSGGASSTFSCGYADAKYRILSDGPLFTEIETSFKNLVQAAYPTVDKQYLEMKYRTKVFKNGYIKVDAQHRLPMDLPENILYGSECRIQMDSTATKTIRAGYNSIWTDNSVKRSISLRYANGDVRRDDGEVNTLAQRPSVININTTSSYTRADVGWAQFSSSILGAPKDWAWTMGFSINMNEPESDNVVLSNLEHNPVTGFASAVSLYPRIRTATIMPKLANLISGIVSWSDLDASTTDTADGAFNTIAGSLVRHLYSGQGTFDAEYEKFDAWATKMYGGIANIHMGSAAEYKGLQFASRLVLPQLNWFYQVALKKGDTAKVEELKVAIANMASDCHNAFGGVGKANSNFYAASHRAWGLAVMAGLDPDGTYAADMDMVDGQFSSSSYFEGVTNIITDNPGENVGGMRYLHYQMYAYNNYLLGCKAAGREPVIDMKTYMLNAISAYGGLCEIDYCVAESRRGNPTTVAFMLYPLLHSGDVSCIDAADRLLKAFEEYGGSNTLGQIKLWDLNFLSVITTSFSEYTFACNILADTWMQWWLDNNS